MYKCIWVEDNLLPQVSLISIGVSNAIQLYFLSALVYNFQNTSTYYIRTNKGRKLWTWCFLLFFLFVVLVWFNPKFSTLLHCEATPLIAEILCVKIVGASVVSGFLMKKFKNIYPENMKKIMGAIWELPAKYQSQFEWKWVGLAVLFIR